MRRPIPLILCEVISVGRAGPAIGAWFGLGAASLEPCRFFLGFNEFPPGPASSGLSSVC